MLKHQQSHSRPTCRATICIYPHSQACFLSQIMTRVVAMVTSLAVSEALCVLLDYIDAKLSLDFASSWFPNSHTMIVEHSVASWQ